MNYSILGHWVNEETGKKTPQGCVNVLEGTLNDFAQHTITTNVCCASFHGDLKDNQGNLKRQYANIPHQGFLFFDFDGKIDDEGNPVYYEVKEILDAFKSLNCPFIATSSKSHMIEKEVSNDAKTIKRKIICPRMHIHIPLKKPIINKPKVNKDLLDIVMNRIGLLDNDLNAVDGVRFFYQGKKTKVINGDLELLDMSVVAQRLEELDSEVKELERKFKKPNIPKDIIEEDLIEQVMGIVLPNFPDSIDGQGGNKTTFSVACRIKELGGDYSHLQEYNQMSCYPQWDEKDLEKKWDSAERIVTSIKPEAYLKAIINNNKKGTK